MPIILGMMTAIVLVTAIKGNQADLLKQVKKDFTGSGNFLVWILAIVLIGAIGYIPQFRAPSKLIIALVLIVFLVANKGIFANLQEALKNTTWASQSSIEGQANVIDPNTVGTPGQGATPSSGGGGSTPAPSGGDATPVSGGGSGMTPASGGGGNSPLATVTGLFPGLSSIGR